MEEYLKKDYDVYEMPGGYEESDIIPFFEDNGRDYFDCGEGYCQDEATVIILMQGHFYKVYMEAEIESWKQEYGDRMYRCAGVRDVRWHEIDKPKEKERETYCYTLYLSDSERRNVEKFLNDNDYRFE